MQELRSRAQADEAYTWRLEDLYESDALWEADFSRAEAEAAGLAALEGKLKGGAQGLLEILRALEGSSLLLEKLYAYARMRRDEDNANPLHQAQTDRATGLLVRHETASSFFGPALIKLGGERVRGYIAQEMALLPYARFLEKQLRMEMHTLSPEIENLLAASGEMADAPDTIYSMLTEADFVFPEITGEDGQKAPMSHGRYRLFLESRNREVRKAAYEAMHGQYKAFSNSIAAAFSASVKKDRFYAQARKFPTTLEATLFPNSIPATVYDSLIEAVRRHLPAFHRYVALRKRTLKLDELHFYDLYVQIVPPIELGLPYDEAARLVRQGLKPLGETYLADLEQAFQNRWIDVYENKGKTTGAYSWGTHSAHPYVLLNYNQTLDSVFTLAHELGHSMHSFYSNKAQPPMQADYPLFLAEIASTTNEALLLDHMKKQAEERGDRAALLALVNHELEQIKGTVFRQTMFAEFETKAHALAQEGQALTKELLCEIYKTLNEEYFGEAISLDEFIPYEWMRIPHFYRAFYVYQYATGYSAAVAFSRSILAHEDGAAEKYLGFLSAGGSKDPLDVLSDAGLDMRSPAAVESCMQAFEQALDRLEALLKEG
ncbi:MAG: oligoendopeptidase F [Christensenellaceae bacterium]|jgi:oligoendopeptidase F|nr:oligoendopeptidase F [Christensenellaceae bacterium]